jgi:hypothetical protein
MDENTFSRFTELEYGLQWLIDEGISKKEEIIMLLEKGLHDFDFYQLGYDIAYGNKGTGWLEVADIEEYRAMSPEEIIEDVDRWTETDQWNHEVGLLLQKHYRNDAEEMMTARDDWVSGYIAAIHHMLEKLVDEVE